ncbi:MBL fold metallo-hydrolase [Patescibacteria group bacterium]|nr:MBL fold metallo-hydrolase [Patescibacteria group bacterium]MCL5114398.1 MBL fold metallo-hydrolase [Patescibacteria group bacterium]
MEEEKGCTKELKIVVDFVERHFKEFLPFLLVVVVISVLSLGAAGGKNSFAEYFLPVGEGDSELIVTASGAKILIDGGPANSAVLESLDAILPPFDRSIDIVIMTHAQIDHFGGLMDVVKNYHVGLFLWNGIGGGTETFEAFKKILNEENVASLVVAEGDRIMIGKTEIRILSPNETLLAGDDLNDSAIVIKVDAEDIKSAFMSDASLKIEETLAVRIGRVDVLKVAHHGSKGSLSKRFFSIVSPSIAVIEVGKNSYGHPSAETVSALGAVGVRVFRTDEEGIVKVEKTAAGNIGVFAVQ